MQFLERNIHIANDSLINNLSNSTGIEMKVEFISVLARMDISSAGIMVAVIRKTDKYIVLEAMFLFLLSMCRTHNVGIC